MRPGTLRWHFLALFQYLKQFLDCGFKSVRVLLDNNPLAQFSQTFFGFASQGWHLRIRQLASGHNSHELV